MKTTTKFTRLLLTFGSFVIVGSSEAFMCPDLTGDEISTTCLTTEAERLGMEAGEIVVGGVRLINNRKNCNTWTSINSKLKLGQKKISGTFKPQPGAIENGKLVTQGICVYVTPKIFGGTQEIEFDVITSQKVIEGVRVHQMASEKIPKIGEERVVNPEAHEKKPTIVQSVQNMFQKKEEATETTPPPSYHHELKERQENQAPKVVQNGPMPEPIMDYKGSAPKSASPTRPKPLTPEELKLIERMKMYQQQGPKDLGKVSAEPLPSSQPSTNPPMAVTEPVKPNRQPPPVPMRGLPPSPSDSPKATPAPETQDQSAEVTQDFRSELEKRLEQQRARAQAQ
jgi:hypothetical protein